MRRVDGFRGKKFLLTVLAAYFFTFFFSYFYFMAASPLVTGNAIANMQSEQNAVQIMDPYLIKAVTAVAILIGIFIFVYLIPRLIHKKFLKSKKQEVQKYKPFRS